MTPLSQATSAGQLEDLDAPSDELAQGYGCTTGAKRRCARGAPAESPSWHESRPYGLRAAREGDSTGTAGVPQAECHKPSALATSAELAEANHRAARAEDTCTTRC